MKKTIILALCAATIPAAFAASNYNADTTAIFTDLSKDASITIDDAVGTATDTTINYTATTGTFTASVDGGLSYGTNQQCTNLTFALDLGALQSVLNNATDNTTYTLVAFYFQGASTTTTDEETGTSTTTYPNSGKNGVALRFNASTGEVFTAHSDNYGSSWTRWVDNNDTTLDTTTLSGLTSTMVLQTGTGGGNAYLNLFNDEGTGILTRKGLGSKNNNAVTSIVVDTDFITAASIEPTRALNAEGMKAAAAAIPEPATATLSLLALAGLAARRRRK